jgi:hypothetical protein
MWWTVAARKGATAVTQHERTAQRAEEPVASAHVQGNARLTHERQRQRRVAADTSGGLCRQLAAVIEAGDAGPGGSARAAG